MTRLHISPNLLEGTRRLGNHKTAKEAVAAALREYIRERKQMRIFELAGKIDFDSEFDLKAVRQRR